MLTIAPFLTTTPALVGRIIICYEASVGPGVHTVRSDVRSLAFIEEYWRLPPEQSDPLCSDVGYVRLYSTNSKVYYVIDTWCIESRAGTHHPQRRAPNHSNMWAMMWGSKRPTPDEFKHVHLKEQPENLLTVFLYIYSPSCLNSC